jgi:hypothetical protein
MGVVRLQGEKAGESDDDDVDGLTNHGNRRRRAFYVNVNVGRQT